MAGCLWLASAMCSGVVVSRAVSSSLVELRACHPQRRMLTDRHCSADSAVLSALESELCTP